MDAIRFVYGLMAAEGANRSPADTVAMLCDLSELGESERGFLQRRYRNHGIDAAQHAAWTCLTWVHSVAPHVDALAVDPKRLDAEVAQVLRRVSALIAD
jgi:hypothetical protein